MTRIALVTGASRGLGRNTALKGVYFLTQALLPLIADGGRIVNVSSGLTRGCSHSGKIRCSRHSASIRASPPGSAGSAIPETARVGADTSALMPRRHATTG